MPHEVSASRTTNPFPDQRSGEHEPAPEERDKPAPDHEEPLGSVRPVPFDRLLSVAALTPAQASLLAVQLLDAAHGGAHDAVGGTHGFVPTVGAVTLTSSGALDVRRPDASRSTPVTELV